MLYRRIQQHQAEQAAREAALNAHIQRLEEEVAVLRSEAVSKKEIHHLMKYNQVCSLQHMASYCPAAGYAMCIWQPRHHERHHPMATTPAHNMSVYIPCCRLWARSMPPCRWPSARCRQGALKFAASSQPPRTSRTTRHRSRWSQPSPLCSRPHPWCLSWLSSLARPRP